MEVKKVMPRLHKPTLILVALVGLCVTLFYFTPYFDGLYSGYSVRVGDHEKYFEYPYSEVFMYGKYWFLPFPVIYVSVYLFKQKWLISNFKFSAIFLATALFTYAVILGLMLYVPIYFGWKM